MYDSDEVPLSRLDSASAGASAFQNWSRPHGPGSWWPLSRMGQLGSLMESPWTATNAESWTYRNFLQLFVQKL